MKKLDPAYITKNFITYVDPDELRDLKNKFLDKFYSDPRPFYTKLKEIGLSKGGFSFIKNNDDSLIKKKTAETIRAWFEGRPPKYLLASDNEWYCVMCERVLPINTKRRNGECKDCHYVRNYRNPRNQIARRAYKMRQQILWSTDGAIRDQYLMSRQERNLKTAYGDMWKVMQTVLKARKEILSEHKIYSISRKQGNSRIKTIRVKEIHSK